MAERLAPIGKATDISAGSDCLAVGERAAGGGWDTGPPTWRSTTRPEPCLPPATTHRRGTTPVAAYAPSCARRRSSTPRPARPLGCSLRERSFAEYTTTMRAGTRSASNTQRPRPAPRHRVLTRATPDRGRASPSAANGPPCLRCARVGDGGRGCGGDQHFISSRACCRSSAPSNLKLTGSLHRSNASAASESIFISTPQGVRDVVQGNSELVTGAVQTHLKAPKEQPSTAAA